MLSYLEFEHGAQLLLPDLQGANFVGKIHDGGVETLVLLLKGESFVTSWPVIPILLYFICVFHAILSALPHSLRTSG